MEYPKRKENRLQEFDYSSVGAYFITICTAGRKNSFWLDDCPVTAPENVALTQVGSIVQNCILAIPIHYPAVSVDCYAVMPNHVHLLLQIKSDADGRSMSAPTVSSVIRSLKGTASKQAGFSIWQKGFYDHVIRNDADYLNVMEYIVSNPIRWSEDKQCLI